MGKRPEWIRQALAAGKALEDFLIGATGAKAAQVVPAAKPAAKPTRKAAARTKVAATKRAPAKKVPGRKPRKVAAALATE
jgi:hypothetical protein